MTTHPMTAAMLDRIRRIHDAILTHTDPTSELEGDFLDLLDSLAGNESADAKRAAQEAIDIYMDDQDGISEGDTGNDGPDPLRERFPTE